MTVGAGRFGREEGRAPEFSVLPDPAKRILEDNRANLGDQRATVPVRIPDGLVIASSLPR